jgi:hypothetical protein
MVETTLTISDWLETAGAGQNLSCTLIAKTYLLVGTPQGLLT